MTQYQDRPRSGGGVAGLLAGRGSMSAACAAVVLALAIEKIYESFLSPVYRYQHFRYLEPSFASFTTHLALVAVAAYAAGAMPYRPSSIILKTLLPLTVIPMTTISLIHPATAGAIAWKFNLATFASYFLAAAVSSLPPVTLPRPRVSPTWFWSAIAVWTLAVYLYLGLAFGGFNLEFSALDDVYTTRHQARSILGAHALSLYLLNWQGHVINPLIVGEAWRRGKARYFVLGVGLQFGLYSLSANRSFLLSIALIVMLQLIAVRSNRRYLTRITMALTSLIPIALFLDSGATGGVAVALLVSRMFVLPAVVSVAFVEFFSENRPLFLGDSRLGSLVGTSGHYDSRSPRLIGDLYFGDSEINANVNLFADGYANGRVVGVLMVGIVLGLLLWIVNSAARGFEPRLVVSIFGLMIVSFANESILVTPLSGGLGLAVLLALLYPRSAASVDPTQTRGVQPKAEPRQPSRV